MNGSLFIFICKRISLTTGSCSTAIGQVTLMKERTDPQFAITCRYGRMKAEGMNKNVNSTVKRTKELKNKRTTRGFRDWIWGRIIPAAMMGKKIRADILVVTAAADAIDSFISPIIVGCSKYPSSRSTSKAAIIVKNTSTVKKWAF